MLTISIGHKGKGKRQGDIQDRLLGMGLEFRVIWEIEMRPTVRKEEVKKARTIQLTPDMSPLMPKSWIGKVSFLPAILPFIPRRLSEG
jgi:hypothetical protein